MDPRVHKFLTREAGLPISVGAQRDTSGQVLYAAWLTDFPGCITQAPTETEAFERLMGVAPVFLETYLATGGSLEVADEEPGIAAGYIQFYDEVYGGSPSISEPRRLETAEAKVIGTGPATDIEFKFATC